MARLAPRTSRPSRCDLLPYIATGDYYVFRSPATGRTEYVHPRMMQERFFPIVKNGYSSISPLGTDDIGSSISQSLFMTASNIADVVAQTAEQAALEVEQESLAEQARNTGQDVVGALRREGALFQVRERFQTATTGRNLLLLGVGALGVLGVGWLIWGRRR